MADLFEQMGGGLLSHDDDRDRYDNSRWDAKKDDADNSRDDEEEDTGVTVAREYRSFTEAANVARKLPKASIPQNRDWHAVIVRGRAPDATHRERRAGARAEREMAEGNLGLLDVLAAEDCGTIINPMIVDGQVQGAVVQGIGGALFEHLLYGADGQILKSTFVDYLLPTATEIPDIHVVHLETPSPITIGGVKGMAESGAVATPAAVANAVADALSPFGVVIESLPLSPQAVIRLLEPADREDPSS